MLENIRQFKDGRMRHRILCLRELSANDRSDEVPPGVDVDYLYPVGVTERPRLSMIRDMVRIVKMINPDLMHCALPNAGLGSRISGRILGVPVVESLVNISHEAIRMTDNPAVAAWKLSAHRLLDRFSMRSVARFQALSEAVARSWIETVGIPPGRVVVIPRGIDLARFAVPDRDQSRRELLHSLGLADDAFVVLNIGRQVPQKGQIYAVRALPHLLEKVPTAVLLSAGTAGPMSDRLRKEADELGVAGRVVWLGVRSDIPQLLSAADAFVFPSLYEGLGVSLLEAMAAGVACVTTDKAPMTEVVTDGENGMLVKPQDPQALALALSEVALNDSLRKTLGETARRHIADSFSSESTAERIEALYQSILELEAI